jgi:uncharacterized protein (DUF2252 family)
MRAFASQGSLDVWYARLDVESVMGEIEAEPKLTKQVRKGVAKARAKDSTRALEKLTHVVDGELRILADPPLIVPAEELMAADETRDLEEALLQMLDSYRASLPADRQHLLDGYRFRHLARKVVGVGSVGTRAWIILMTGRDDKDPLFLQAKEAQASVLEPYVGASAFDNHGQRVVEGQWLMQAASDSFLGWCPAVGIDGKRRDFYVRQLWDGKGSTDIEAMGPQELGIYASLCGWTLARAHARSGDAIAIGAYLGSGESFDKALAEFSRRYADQNELDHAALVAEIAAGRVVAVDA